jgi:putative heme-binding domain-containing protein
MHRIRLASFRLLLVGLVGTGAMPLSRAERLELLEGSHICIIGGGVAEAMQHSGWLEVYLHSRFPAHRLVIRNLGFEGDEVDPAKRLRSADFGTPDQWLAGAAPIPRPDDVLDRSVVRENRFELTGTRADVVLAFFGSNEAHAGPAGIPGFKTQVEAFIRHTLAQRYNGVSAPRLVMFSPIGHENLDRPHWPDGRGHNANLRLYTTALEEVCRAEGVECVDLLTVTLAAYETSAEPLTVDGIHPNAEGDRIISRIIDEALFGGHPARDPRSLARLQAAVADKNFYWFHRYRVTDGYSTYGGRAWLKFTPGAMDRSYKAGQTNYEVAQRELEYLDVQTANRDRRIWATAATLEDPLATLPAVEEVGLPELVPVFTNKPGSLENGRHEFLSGTAAIEKMTVHEGMKVELVADEIMFPELINPVQMAFDTRGRLWVAAWPTYPHWRPDEPMNDKLLILEDADGDGRTDRVKTFAGDLHNPTGFEFWGRGVIVAQGPDVLYLEDTDGDDHYNVKTRVLRGLDTADTHHTANSFTLDPAGSLYFQEGTFHHSQPESPWGPPARTANGAVFRYEPRTGKIGLYTSYSFANPHGHAFDRWGDDIVVDGTGAVPYWGSVFSTRLDGMDKHSKAPTVYKQRTRPCPGIEVLSSPHFPADMQGNLLVGNVIGFQGILRYRFEAPEDAAAAFPRAIEAEPIVSSSDPNFRPADLELGPDGAIYFTDWQNPIIGHMQHNLRDPSRDRLHGRVYRVVMEGRPLVRPLPIAEQPVAELVRLLADSTDRVRYRARIELSGRPEAEVVAAVESWLAGLDAGHVDFEHHRLEALWILRHFDRVDPALVEAVLASRDPRARAAGLRVLATISDRVPQAEELVMRAAADEAPRVRLEALRTASYLRTPSAVEALAITEEFPTDEQMAYVRKEAARVLEPEFRRAMDAGETIAFSTDAGRRYVFRAMTNDQLSKEPRSPLVYREMLLRSGLDERLRIEAVEALARADGSSVVKVVVDALTALDQKLEEKSAEIDSATVFELIRTLLGRPPRELVDLRSDLERLATTGRRPMMRQIGYVGLLNIDALAARDRSGATVADPCRQVWELAQVEPRRLVDLIAAVPLVGDPAVTASLYDRIIPLLDGLPDGKSSRGPAVRYVRVELPGKGRPLTLAEVEVFAEGVNVARQGRATQIDTGHGGDASRAIDGNTHPEYGKGGQTHTQESSNNPWWEVDLGRPRAVDRIVVHNRGEGSLGKRLEGFTLRALDENREEVFRADKQPAPALTAEFGLGSDAGVVAAAIRRAVFAAIVGVKGREEDAFRRISRFIREDIDRDAAIRAVSRMPVGQWPAEEATKTLAPLIDSIRRASAQERSSDAGLAAWQFAETLTRLLPPDEGKARRAELAELGVRVVRIGTVYERMAYDRETIAVQAGRPVLFVLENVDAMPHNFVITRPGAMQSVGELAESQAQNPAFAKQGFVPKSPAVLVASGLMQPQTMQQVTFTAPTAPGVYPYVCTYPGHWRRMYGALYVVDDLEAYLAGPDAYLATHPLEIKDDLLKDRRPRTEWTLADLEASVVALETGRSFVHGRELFRTANCVACHRLGDQGNHFGPELAKLSRDMTPLEITRHILEPSLKIEEKYRSTSILTEDGRAITGLVVEDTPTELAIVENPVAKAEPVRIAKNRIDERTVSAVSIMPKGLLDKLTRDEVLDLIAYVVARGDETSSLFSPGGCPHHAP